MNAQWRLFLAALGWVRQGIPTTENGSGSPAHAALPHQASRFVPVVGIFIGLIAAVVYWATAQIWPTSVAVVLSMLAAALMTATRKPSRTELGAAYWVFVLFIKYNALMALSSANVPLPLPAYCALGLIMIAAQAASRGLVVSVITTDSPAAPQGATAQRFAPASKLSTLPHGGAVPYVTTGDLVIALALGLAPAVLLGIPGLVGLVAAIAMRLGLTAHALRKFHVSFASQERLEVVQQLTELSFYLGALASWKYV